MHPVPCERVAGGVRLGQLVLVVREAQVQAAAVDVEARPEIPRGHRRALDVPARPAAAPRGRPTRRRRLVRLVAFPQREVARVPLAAQVGIRRLRHVVEALPGQFPVGRPGLGVEVHVAGAVVGRIGVAALDEPGDERLHLADARRGPRLVGGGQDAEGLVPGGELQLVAVGQRPPLLRMRRIGLLARRGEDLVVDVGDVAHQGDPVAAIGEPAPPLVVHERGPEVADVRGRLHGGAADVDADFAFDKREQGRSASGTWSRRGARSRGQA